MSSTVYIVYIVMTFLTNYKGNSMLWSNTVATMASVMQHVQHVLLFLVVAVNSVQSQFYALNLATVLFALLVKVMNG